MPSESFTVEAIAHVVGGRKKPTDDYWGGARSILRIDGPRFDAWTTEMLTEYFAMPSAGDGH